MASGLAARLALELSEPRTLATAVVLLAIFVASSLAPLVLGERLEDTWIGRHMQDQLEQLGDAAEEGGFAGLAAKIFVNNLKVSALLAVLYFTVVVPVFVLVLNGMVLGYLPLTGLMEDLLRSLGSGTGSGGALLYYAGLVPHGLLELTTIVLVASLVSSGLRGGVRAVAGRVSRRLAMAAVNLVVAAAVETTVTPVVMVVVLGIIAGL